MSRKTWDSLVSGEYGGIVRDLRLIASRGFLRFAASELNDLPWRFSEAGEPATTLEIRSRLIGFLMTDDPTASPSDDPNQLSTGTNARLALFRVSPRLQQHSLEAARAELAEVLKPDRPVSVDAVRKPGGAEWYIIRDLSEAIGRATKPQPRDDQASYQVARHATVPITTLYRASSPSELAQGFWWRASTSDALAHLRNLESITIFLGSDDVSGSSSVEKNYLYTEALARWLDGSYDFGGAAHDVAQSLAQSHSPHELGSALRFLYESSPGLNGSNWLGAVLRERHLMSTDPGPIDRLFSAIAFAALGARKAGRYSQIVSNRLEQLTSRWDDGASALAVTFGHLELVDTPVRIPQEDSSPEGVPVVNLVGNAGRYSDPAAQVGELDGLSVPDAGPRAGDEPSRADWCRDTFARGSVLFVADQLNDPAVLSGLAAAKRAGVPHFALLAPRVNRSREPEYLSAALRVVAARYLHLGVVPILADSTQQIEQTLIELAYGLALGDQFVPYRDRLTAWWSVIGRPLEAVRRRDDPRHVMPEWFDLMEQLTTALGRALEQLQVLADDRGIEHESIRSEVWIRNPERRTLVRVDSQRDAEETQIMGRTPSPAVRAFQAGHPVVERGPTDVWAALPITVSGGRWYQLPIGALVFRSTDRHGLLAYLAAEPQLLSQIADGMGQTLQAIFAPLI